MAPKNQIRLEAIAAVQQARADILDLAAKVNLLSKAVGETSDDKFEIQTNETVEELNKLEKELNDVSEKVKKAEQEFAAAQAAGAEASRRATDKIIADIEKKDAAQERAKIKAGIRTQVQAESARKAGVAEAAAADKAAQAVVDAENKKATAQERAKVQQAVRLAEKIAGEQRAAAAVEAATKQEIDAAHAAAIAYDKKRTALLQAQEAQNKFAAAATSAANAIRTLFASIVLQKMKDFIVDIVDTQAAMEGYTNAMIAAVGGTKQASEEIQRLRQFSDLFGLSFETLVQKFGRFSIASSSTRLSMEETRAVFEGFAIVNRALGNSTESTARVFTALEQSMSKGVLQSEELKQQLGDSLPGAYTKLAAAIGVTTAELEKMLKENKILSEEALPALAAELLRTLGPAVIRNATSTRAEIERLKNEIFATKVVLGEAAKNELAEFLRLLRQIGTEGTAGIDTLGRALSGVFDRLSDIVKIIDDLASGRIFSALGQVMNVLLENMNAVNRAFLNFAINVKETIGEISKEEAAAQRKFLAGWIAPLEEVAEGFDELAKHGKSSAEEIADATNVQGRRIKEAYDASLSANEATYARFVALAKEQSQELTKAEIKELNKREDAFQSFFAKIADLALKNPVKIDLPASPESPAAQQSLISPTATKEVSDAAKKVDELTKSLAKLIAERDSFQDGGFVKPEQLNRLNEMQQSITQVKRALREAQDAAKEASLQAVFDENAAAAEKLQAKMASFAASVKAALVDLVRDNDAFRESFALLDEESQIAVEGMVGGLERLAATGTATEADFRAFLEGVATVFGNAGVIGQEFAAGLATSFGQADQSAAGLLASFAAMSAGVQSESTGAKEAVESIGAAADASAIRVQESGKVSSDAFLKQAESAKGAADKSSAAIRTITDEATRASLGMADAVTRGMGDSVAAITNTIDFASGKVDDFGGLVETIGANGERSFSIIGEAAKNTGAAVESAVVAITDSEGKIVGLETKIEQAGDAAVKAFKEAKEATSGTATEVKAVEKATVGAKTSSEGLAKAAAATKASTEATPAALDRMSAALDTNLQKTAILKSDWQQILNLCQQVVACMKEMGEA